MSASTQNTQELRRELLLSQAVSRHQEELVKLATRAVLQLIGSKMKTSQLRNALNVVQQPDASYDLVANFIRYKIATQGESWGKGRESFGHTVIEHLRKEVDQQANKTLTWLKNQPGTDKLPNQEDLAHEIYLVLMRRYVGYAIRAFAYYEKADNKTEAEQQLREAAK